MQKREGDATTLNIFIGVLTNENTGRESEAPAELFRPRDRPQVLVDAKWPPNKAPQERRSPVMMDRTMKRCLELWGDAPAEFFGAAIGRPPALGADLATEKSAAGASLYADKKCGTVVPNRFAEGQRTEVNSSFSNG